MFPIKAASDPNCLIGGSRAHVFTPPPQLIDIEACLPPSRSPLLMMGFHCPISTATNTHQRPSNLAPQLPASSSLH